MARSGVFFSAGKAQQFLQDRYKIRSAPAEKLSKNRNRTQNGFLPQMPAARRRCEQRSVPDSIFRPAKPWLRIHPAAAAWWGAIFTRVTQRTDSVIGSRSIPRIPTLSIAGFSCSTATHLRILAERKTHAVSGRDSHNPHNTQNPTLIDETYIRVKGEDKCLYRALDSTGQMIDFLLTAKRDTAAAKRFLRRAIDASGNPMRRVMNVDKNPAYPAAMEALKADGTIPRRVALRQCKYCPLTGPT